jgi:hypothetical protein
VVQALFQRHWDAAPKLRLFQRAVSADGAGRATPGLERRCRHGRSIGC